MVTIFITYIIIPASRVVARKGWERVEALMFSFGNGDGNTLSPQTMVIK